MSKTKILEINDDTLTFERAFIATNENGVLGAYCTFSGILCQLGNQPAMIEDGIVACWPVDLELHEHWPLSVTVLKEDAVAPEVIWRCTGNPLAVAAAKRFLKHLEEGTAREGLPL